MVTSPTSAAAGTRPAKVPKPVRPRRDFAAMEARRMAAVDMFEEGGLSKAEIGRRLGVSHQTVSDWHGLWAEGGRDALRGAGRPQAAFDGRAAWGGGGCDRAGRQGERLPDGSVDPGPGRRGDRADYRNRLPPGACVEDLARPAGLFPSAPGSAGGRTGRRGGRVLDQDGMAEDKKRGAPGVSVGLLAVPRAGPLVG